MRDIQQVWHRIEQVLQRHVPKTFLTLAPPAKDEDIAALESMTGLKLPDDFRWSLKVHNGQDDPTRCHSFVVEGLFANTTQILETWCMLNKIQSETLQYEPSFIADDQGEWWNRHWVPFTIGDGDCLCLNLNPDSLADGGYGQVICHVHDSECELGIAESYGKFLLDLAEKLEKNDFEIDEFGYLYLNI